MRATRYFLSLVAFVLGIALAPVVNLSYPTLLWLLLLSVIAALMWRRVPSEHGTMWLYASLFLAFFVLGAWRFAIHETSFDASVLQSQVGDPVSLEGVVQREPEQRETSLHLYVDTGSDTVLVTTDRYASIAYGDVVSVEGTLRVPESFTTDLGRTFDYPRYLQVRDVEFMISFAEVSVVRVGEGNWIITSLLGLKNRFLVALGTALPEPEAGLGAGVLLGVKQALGESLERAFRETGIIHIVVLSGYNIMLVVTFITFVLGSFLSLRARVITSLLAIAAFALMVGLSATVLRACLMAAILLIAQVAHRQYLALRALMLAGAVMLMINPYLLLYDIGFQLSFVATLGLILLTPYIERLCFFLPNRLSLRQFLAATVSTQIAVLPLLMYHIGEVSVVGVLVNLLVLPMVPVAMLLAFAVGVTSWLLPLITPLLSIFAYGSLHYIVVIASKFAALPFAAVPIPQFSLLGVVILYALYAVVLWYLIVRYPLLSSTSKSVMQLPAATTVETDLSAWTIVEEADGSPEYKTKVGAVKLPVPTDDTPIFFR
jgi:competence protein ComEC